MPDPLIDIRPDHWAIVADILRRHVPDREVWAFGSRAKWTAKEYSDLDLAVIGETPLSLSVSAALSNDFAGSDLPFKVDVVDWATTSESFRKIIERDKVVVQERKGRSLGMGGEWHVTTLDKAPLEIIDGDRGTNYPNQAEFSSRGHCLFLNAGNVTASGFSFSDCAFITPEKDALLRKGKLVRNDVVLTTRGTVGNSAYFDDSVPFQHIRINSGMVILRARQTALHPRYLYLFIGSALCQAQVAALRTGSAQPQLPIRDINRIEIPVPPLPEQRAIAHILGTLDDKIELNRRMNETLEAMARALFKSWFVDFDPVRAKTEGRDPGLPKAIADIFPDRFEDSELGEIPEGWKVRSIGDLADVVGGSTPSTSKSEFWEGGRHCWATPKDLAALDTPVLLDTERRITDAGLAQISSALLPKGTVLLSSRAPIGYLAVAEIPVAINQGFIAMKPKKPVSNMFLLLWTRSAHEEILSRANGSTFLEISKSSFRPIPVARATDRAFAAFDSLVQPLYRSVVGNERQSRTLVDLRDTLLPKLISGEIRVPDAERLAEAAS